MREVGFVVAASARILRRVWQIYVAHVFLFTIFLAEISDVATRFENPLYTEEMGILDFLKEPDVTIVQALLLRIRPVNMDVLPLYIVLMVFLPVILWLMRRKRRRGAGAVGAALRGNLGVRFLSLGLSERLLGLQPVCLAIVVRVRRLVRARRRAADVAHPCVPHHVSRDFHRLSVVFSFFHHVYLVRPAVRSPRPAQATRAMDISDQQDRSGRVAFCAFPGAGRGDRALSA